VLDALGRTRSSRHHTGTRRLAEPPHFDRRRFAVRTVNKIALEVEANWRRGRCQPGPKPVEGSALEWTRLGRTPSGGVPADRSRHWSQLEGSDPVDRKQHGSGGLLMHRSYNFHLDAAKGGAGAGEPQALGDRAR
jgi:hypothetical protein